MQWVWAPGGCSRRARWPATCTSMTTSPRAARRSRCCGRPCIGANGCETAVSWCRRTRRWPSQ
eukprot:10513107-Lingulodinium_polyedra.AAC.1